MSSQTTSPLHHAVGNIQRKTANYHPSLWGDYFVAFHGDYKSVDEEREKAEELKAEVKKMLTQEDFGAKPLKERLKIIEAIKRLGVEYHFNQEIKTALEDIFNGDDDQDEDHDLLTVALRFRLLREHGYYVPSDIFNKFKDNKGSFKEEITRDITGMLYLYEAAYLRVHGEDILDEALAFTTTNLQAILLFDLNPSLAKQIESALWTPIRKAMPRVATREFISFYQENEHHNEVLLKFAKLDFNLLLKQHQKELGLISEWWKNLEVEKNFPYARDRIAEGFLWAQGVYYEPQYELGRRFVTKVLNLCSILDDTFDVYGTEEELELFTRAFAWSQQSAMEKLPPYMQIYLQALEELFNEMDKEMAKEGRSSTRCYIKEAFEQQRDHIPSAVECYMNQYGVSEEIACNELNKQVENAWKDVNQSFLDPNTPSMLLQTNVLNLTRMTDLVYKEDDGYTRSKKLKHHLTSLLVNLLEV